MGIPGFFGWLMRKYNRNTFVSSTIGREVDALYVDANCMLHPSCFKILSKDDSGTIDELEERMISQCIDDLDYLIKFVCPKKKLYIAVDGTAPFSKINQQRKRRYKSLYDTQIKNDIKRNLSQHETPTKWTNASITPGTEFMEKLHNALLGYVRTLKCPKTVIYSSYHTPGEGEHKIFDHIRENPDTHIKVVYGLDADLIFLAMTNPSNIFLIREEQEVGQSTNDEQLYTYVNVNTIIRCFHEQLYELMAQKSTCANNFGEMDVTNDIIFICYLLGNDFIPHIPTIDIKHHGMEMILDSYITTYAKHRIQLVNISHHEKNTRTEITINVVFFDDFISHLSTLEKHWLETFDDFNKNPPRKPDGGFDTPYDERIWQLENMLLIRSDDVYKRHIGTFDDWKFRYYEHYFGCSESQEQTVSDVCQNYLDGITWIARYYFGRCPSWTWTYNYSHAPFLSDISKFIKTQHYNINNISFDVGNPVDSVTQLMCVIPTEYSFLLPKNYVEIMQSDLSISYMFPHTFQLDTMNKDAFWKCIPLLPNVDLQKITKIVDMLPKNKRTDKLNKQIGDFVI